MTDAPIRLMVVEDHLALRQGLELLLGRQVRNAMTKLQAKTRVHAIAIALQRGEIAL